MSFKKHKAKQESYFDINLAPMLDIIVSIVPMLLMSVVFIRVNMIEAQIPQIVAEAIENNKKDQQKVTVALQLTEKQFKFEVVDNGKKDVFAVAFTGNKADFDKLYNEALIIKRKYPEVFKVEVKPTKNITLDQIVSALDSIRQSKGTDGTFTVKDNKTGNTAQTNLMFPEVVFSEVLSGA